MKCPKCGGKLVKMTDEEERESGLFWEIKVDVCILCDFKICPPCKGTGIYIKGFKSSPVEEHNPVTCSHCNGWKIVPIEKEVPQRANQIRR